ncbi:hypothetical protein B0T10DRAFT_488158 [Thelonectria olida]|uniref:NWD NACHT-NTPase N-terminal domain-containing protein n=1 Tax=Thelonectria olida TaxID=1576542 RepID=A0A9P8W2Z6_9HYPO|nr:hypothetical protein B0T10DRAFT_488158 [Thelonectria olida]
MYSSSIDEVEPDDRPWDWFPYSLPSLRAPMVNEVSLYRLQERLWNEAYDQLKVTEPEMVEEYERVLLEHFDAKNATPTILEPGENKIGETRKTRCRQMEVMAKAGLDRLTKLAILRNKVEKKDYVLKASLFRMKNAVQSAPEAALAWVAAYFGLLVLYDAKSEPDIDRVGTISILCSMIWSWDLPGLLFEVDETAKGPSQGLLDKTKSSVVHFYQKLLLFEMKTACLYHGIHSKIVLNIHDLGSLFREMRNAQEKALRNLPDNRSGIKEEFENVFYFKEEIRRVYSTLLLITTWRNTELAQQLLEEGADVNAHDGSNGTPLQRAASTENMEMARLLLKHGADVNMNEGHDRTPLLAAASRGNMEMALLFLKHGADVNAQREQHDNTSLQAAVLFGSVEMVRLFLDHGANVSAQGGEDGTALCTAVRWGKTEKVQMLLDGAPSDWSHTQTTRHGKTSLLHAAAFPNNLEVLKMILSLHPPPDINLLDESGRTALHIAVEREGLAVVTELLQHGADTNIQDYSGATPLQLAVQHEFGAIALALFPTTKDNLGLAKAAVWRSLLPGNGDLLEVTKDQFNPIMRRSQHHFTTKGYPLPFCSFWNQPLKFSSENGFMETDIHEKRLFILPEEALRSSHPTGFHCCWRRRRQPHWAIQSQTAPSPAFLAQLSRKDCYVECHFHTRAITMTLKGSDECTSSGTSDSDGSTMSGTSCSDSEGFESPLDIGSDRWVASEKAVGIVWIMTKRQSTGDAKTQSTLESRTFFGTSEYTEVPSSAPDLLKPLVEQLRRQWDDTFEQAEKRLGMKRTELLRASGQDPRLIRDLLADAQLWDLLDRNCSKQITDLRAFRDTYFSVSLGVLHENPPEERESFKRLFDEDIHELEKAHRRDVKFLTEASQNLIQLEFNLVSIAEAQKSTSTNTSMKRLSWITFVFLPLMFIASLFGMNVDVLESNPPWWIYLPLALGTSFLTLVVWLTFKFSYDLEERIERVFRRLPRLKPSGGIKSVFRRVPRWKREDDIETGQSEDSSSSASIPRSRQMTEMFSAFGKKRS